MACTASLPPSAVVSASSSRGALRPTRIPRTLQPQPPCRLLRAVHARRSCVRRGHGALRLSSAASPSATLLSVSAPASPFVEHSFGASTVYAVALFALMLLPVGARTQPLRRVAANLWTFAPLAVLYLALLVLSWQPDTLSLMLPGSFEEGLRSGCPQFFPRLEGIQALLSRRVTAASAWVHLLTVNAFAGRYAYLDATRRRLPCVHSLLLCLLAGPAGLACHLLTRGVVTAWRARRRRNTSSTL